MILVDSTVWNDFFNGVITPKSDHQDNLLGKRVIFVGDKILGEVLQGFRSDHDFEQAHQALDRFQQVSLINPEGGTKC